MPIYEYQCQSCAHELEKLQKMSDAPLTDCPACGQAELKKKISAAAFRLKGGGWYETDFKAGDKKKNLAGDGTKTSGDAKSSSDTGSSGSSGTAKTAGASKPEGKAPAAS